MMGVLSVSRNFFVPFGEKFAPTREETVEEAALLVRRCAEPAQIGERTKTQQLRAARRLHMTPNQIKKIWHRERRAIPTHEYLHIKATVARLEERRRKRAELRDQVREQAGLVDQHEAGPLERMARDTSLDTD